MGFLEKVKNMFTEEVEEDEVKVEKVERVKKEIISSFNDTPQEESEFGFKDTVEESRPVFFDDTVFDELDSNHKEEKKEKSREDKEEKKEKEQIKTREDKYAKKGNYKESLKESIKEFNEPKEEIKEEKKIFKPTPIISPVYGVLDKNYHKEDIVSKNDVNRVVNEEPSIDQVRNKAYGTLEDELENTLFSKDSALFQDKESTEENVEISKVDDLDLDNLTEDIGKELDELLIKKEKDISKQTKKKKEADVDDDLLNFIDSTLYKEEEGEEE